MIFLIVTTFSQLKQLIAIAVIAAALSAVFPPLAVILGIIAVIMFIAKLKFLFENWRAVLAELQGSINSFNNYNSYSSNHNYNTVNPDTHFVKGHYRNTPAGGVTYVDTHIRTNPDGIESNNISYRE